MISSKNAIQNKVNRDNTLFLINNCDKVNEYLIKEAVSIYTSKLSKSQQLVLST